MPGTIRRTGLGVVTAGVLLFGSLPAVADERESAHDEFVSLLAEFDRSLSSRADDATRRDVRERLAGLDRALLADSEWLDVHIALLALERRLTPMPPWGLRDEIANPAEGSNDPFDRACIAGDLTPSGRERFAWSVRNVHGLRLTPEAILQVGRMARSSTQRDLEHFAEELPGDDTWRELVERVRDHHPASIQELADACRQSLARAHADVDAAGAVTVPTRARDLEVRVAPRATPLPFAFYQPPTQGRWGRGDAQLTIPPIPSALSPDDQAEWLRDFDVHWLNVVAAHEGVPGHHLQHVRAAQVRSRVRAHGFNTTFAEGWAFYAEGILARCTTQEDPLDHVAQLRARSWRAIRCYIDPALHLGRIKPSEAVELLMKEAAFSRRAAESDVRSILRYPARMFGYWIGYRLIERMREEYVKRNGPGTSREFHDRFLSFGTAPVPMLRAILLEHRTAFDEQTR